MLPYRKLGLRPFITAGRLLFPFSGENFDSFQIYLGLHLESPKGLAEDKELPRQWEKPPGAVSRGESSSREARKTRRMEKCFMQFPPASRAPGAFLVKNLNDRSSPLRFDRGRVARRHRC
ncbi:hypothetical protein EVAR_98089_1 [Eumeta japonica]|uniref:Uncharacterized protein n=1 Tax=Eumeta variegata TaxID=151549 RepID=A0A4C1XGM8_EUMVA|nr:hypothetical protein EVAR_98089_1 [Eumeta japonica]